MGQPLNRHSPYMGSLTSIFSGSLTPQLHKRDEVGEDIELLDMSITSSRRPQSGRSNSCYSSHMSHGVSRPQSPLSTNNQDKCEPVPVVQVHREETINPEPPVAPILQERLNLAESSKRWKRTVLTGTTRWMMLPTSARVSSPVWRRSTKKTLPPALWPLPCTTIKRAPMMSSLSILMMSSLILK